MKLKRWVKVVITLIVFYVSYLIWNQTGSLGELSKTSDFYLVLCALSWMYLLIGQMLIYGKIWK